MKTAVYKFTITGQKRDCAMMKIIAHNPIEAICTGLRNNLPISGPVRIVCKPIGRLA